MCSQCEHILSMPHPGHILPQRQRQPNQQRQLTETVSRDSHACNAVIGAMSSFLGVLDHEEAEKCEVLPLAASGCGVTALVNVLVALKVVGAQRPEKESIEVGSLDWSGCILRTRANDAPLPQYLASRAVAGCTGQDLVTSMQLLVQNNTALQGHQLYGRFYSHGEIESMGLTVMGFVEMHLGQGHCPVATLNLQLVGNDAWHHQMIYGIDRQAGGLCNEVGSGSTATTPPLATEDALPTAREGVCVHCVNPVCAYPEYALNAFLSTKSALLVLAEDVLKRFDLPGGDETIYDNLCGSSSRCASRSADWWRQGVGGK
jgi:hypothetical protein